MKFISTTQDTTQTEIGFLAIETMSLFFLEVYRKFDSRSVRTILIDGLADTDNNSLLWRFVQCEAQR